MGGFVVHRYPVLVYIIHNRVLDGIGFRGQDQAALIFHYIVSPRPEEPGVGPALIPGNRVLGLVPVAVAVRRGKDGHSFKLFPRQPVEAGTDPLRFQPGFLGVVHVPKVAAAAELGYGALPVYPVGGFFQDPDDFSRRPGLVCLFDAYQHPLPRNGVGEKHGAAVDVGNALALSGIVRHQGFVFPILFQHYSTFSIPIFCRCRPQFS